MPRYVTENTFLYVAKSYMYALITTKEITHKLILYKNIILHTNSLNLL